MPRERNWQTGDGLLDINDPVEVDDAFARGEPHVGTAVIGLVLNCEDFDAVAPRVERALRSEDPRVSQLAFTATGDTARRFQKLTPTIYGNLRSEGLGGVADTAIKDALTFIPFRHLPWWFKWKSATLSVMNFIEGRWLSLVDTVETCRDALKRAAKGR